MADIKDMYEDYDLDKEGFEMMVEHVEKKRVQKVQLLLQVRIFFVWKDLFTPK